MNFDALDGDIYDIFIILFFFLYLLALLNFVFP